MKEDKPGNNSSTWFLTGQYTSVLNVPATPGGQLASLLRQKIGQTKAPDGGLTKIVEAGGCSISSGMSTSRPEDNTCRYPTKCMADGQVNCGQSKIVYQIECELCCKSSPVDQPSYNDQHIPANPQLDLQPVVVLDINTTEGQQIGRGSQSHSQLNSSSTNQ